MFDIGNVLWLVLFGVVLIFLAISWQIFVRKLADKGLFWVRVPFMKYLAIEVDRVLGWVLVSCTDEVWRRIHPDCEKNDEVCDVAQDGKIKIIRVHEGLKWIGVPWKNQVKDWYETQKDEDDPNVPPLHSVALDEQVFKYSRPIDKNDIIAVPSMTTSDLIEVYSVLILNMVVYNPIKALYYIRHRKTAILNMIVPVWREVIGAFNFFEYGDTLEKDFKAVVKKKLLTLSPDFRIALGISERDSGGNEVPITDPTKFVPGKVAHMIFAEWGTLIRTAAVEDIDPVDPEVQKTFEKMITAVTGALAKKQEAEGDRDAAQIRGEGYKDPDAKFKLVMETIQALAASGNMVISLPEVSDSLKGFISKVFQPMGGGETK